MKKTTLLLVALLLGACAASTGNIEQHIRALEQAQARAAVAGACAMLVAPP